MQKYLFHIQGMHCPACVILSESELGDLPEVVSVKASLAQHTLEIEGDFGGKTSAEIAQKLDAILKSHGYKVSVEKQSHAVKWADFNLAIPIAAAFIALFIILQKLGIVNLVNTGKVGFGTAFFVGMIASVSSCMAVVGGLVLSMSANFAKEGDKVRPQLFFHVGRLVSFFILGGVIGAAGSVFKLGITGTFVVGVVVGLIMLLLGINLLDVFPWAKKLQPTMPKFIAKRAHNLQNLNHTLTPLLVGIATFFLPCGFTQAMQVYALSTGSFASGAMIMGAFALGTLPVLALISFSSVAVNGKANSGIFFKAAGLVVIFFGLFNIINSLVAAGFIAPVFNF